MDVNVSTLESLGCETLLSTVLQKDMVVPAAQHPECYARYVWSLLLIKGSFSLYFVDHYRLGKTSFLNKAS